jgi:preprotein translocase subunit SecY
MLGVGPYITASIIMQLATVIFPKIKAMYTDEGEAGRTKFIMWSRLITIPLAILQGIAFLRSSRIRESRAAHAVLHHRWTCFSSLPARILLMWIGELITEFGIGNGVSLIIFAGIVARIPAGISQALFTHPRRTFRHTSASSSIALIAIFFVVMVSEAERSIPIAYARQVRGAAMQGGAATYLPIRLLQAGVVPIIFALSLILLPQMVLNGSRSSA